jgi:hypothetical protein
MIVIKNSGQSLTELAICVFVISAAFISMQIYVQRGLQAKYKAGADYCLSSMQTQAAGLRKQYDPYYATSRYKESKDSNSLKGFPDRATTEVSSRPGGLDEDGNPYGWKKISTVADAD